MAFGGLLEDMGLIMGNDMYWKSKNVFVTGATGLLGSYLTKRLVERGANVTILLRDWIPKSNLVLMELLKKINVVHGQLEDYFVLERREEGTVFDEIYREKGRGTSQEFHAYEYLDLNPKPGLNYYRLKTVDTDGRGDY